MDCVNRTETVDCKMKWKITRQKKKTIKWTKKSEQKGIRFIWFNLLNKNKGKIELQIKNKKNQEKKNNPKLWTLMRAGGEML